jgi:predicted metal-dependent hydrolase
MEIHEIVWRGQTIRFELQRKKVRNLNLNLKPDMTVMVSANERVPLNVIFDFVRSKASWIIKNTGYFSDAQPEVVQEKEYVSGETFKYLGKQMRLKVVEGIPENIRYSRGYLEMTVKDRFDVKRKSTLVNRWFRERADSVFRDVLEKVFPVIEKYGVKKPEFTFRGMKARWGSCVKDKGIIILNYELIKAPKYCIEYVVLHELVHFIHRNHNADFYGFMTSLMPDWKERKRVLDEEVIRSL